MATKAFRSFQGINNRLPDTQLQIVGDAGVSLAVRDAVNVHMTARNSFKGRAGYTLAKPLPLARSLVSLLIKDEHMALCASGSDLLLYREVAGELTENRLRNDLGIEAAVSACVVGDRIFASDGAGLWTGSVEGLVDCAVPAPLSPPVLSRVGGLSLPAGIYQAFVTHMRGDGQESAPTAKVGVTIAGGGVTVAMPAGPFPDGVVAQHLYMSTANGDTLYLVESFPTPGAFYTVAVTPVYGGQCATRTLAPMPGGSIVRHYKGRLLVAVGNLIYRSQPYAYGLYDPVEDFLAFAAHVDLVVPVEAGFFVCADKTYFIAGDFESNNVVRSYGAASQSDAYLPDGTALWHSHRGLIHAASDGSISNLQEPTVVVGRAAVARTWMRELDGEQHAIVVAPQVEANTLAKSSGFMAL